MAGTKEGGIKAAKKIKEKYGKDHYKKIGSRGGQKTAESGKLLEIGFASDRERARLAGSKGGRASRRNKKPVDKHLQ